MLWNANIHDPNFYTWYGEQIKRFLQEKFDKHNKLHIISQKNISIENTMGIEFSVTPRYEYWGLGKVRLEILHQGGGVGFNFWN